MKKLLIPFFILIMIVFAACSGYEEEIEEIEEMTMRQKLQYARDIGFCFRIYAEGEWYQGDLYVMAAGLAIPSIYRDADDLMVLQGLINQGGFEIASSEDLEVDYTEVRFVHSSEEVEDDLTNIIFAFPTEDNAERIVTALNWEVDSTGFELEEFGLSYPITVEHLVENYEEIKRLSTDESWFQLSLLLFGYRLDTRIEFELDRIGEREDGNTEKVLGIVDKLGMTQDEVAPILRASGSVEAFVAVSDLMLEEGVSAEDVLEQIARER